MSQSKSSTMAPSHDPFPWDGGDSVGAGESRDQADGCPRELRLYGTHWCWKTRRMFGARESRTGVGSQDTGADGGPPGGIQIARPTSFSKVQQEAGSSRPLSGSGEGAMASGSPWGPRFGMKIARGGGGAMPPTVSQLPFLPPYHCCCPFPKIHYKKILHLG